MRVKRWYQGFIIFGLLQVCLFGLSVLVRFVQGQNRPNSGDTIVGNAENDDYYNQFRQPIFAPPDWVFAPVWAVNNALTSWGIVRVINMPENTPGRERFLALQAAFALQYVNFTAAYFGLKSPISGAFLTVGGLVTIGEAMRIALFQMKDWRVVLSLSTLFPWLCLASLTSVAVALWNRDDLLHIPPIIDPRSAWVKQSKSNHIGANS
jgi:translocator protein